ncbi:MAG: UDP-N-acetylmuramoyl-L-alanyl-D-glutamate--2,6-diaminopimelate ligase [Acidobacteriota bacterium]|nr:UDP-N-acetylmuramoyl-L-alanyl-D-glutamate--2,6-diaminopimelate ligase [Acidobacteriota bacterium]
MIETKELLGGVEVLETRGEPPARIGALAYDSREVGPGTCFVALRGTRTDGHRFLDAAENAGAALAVVEEMPRTGSLPCVRVRDTLATMPVLAEEFFRHPAHDMTLAGFTGTNGKTSSTYLLEAIWAAAGVPSAVLGTIQYRWKARAQKATTTTPLALNLHELFSRIRKDGVHHVAMEVSSHALRLHRVDGLLFAAAAFTNLSPDHLDFHRDLEDYGEAKAVLFESHLEADGIGVINTDDAHGWNLFARLPGDRRLSFGLEAGVDITAEDAQLTQDGTVFVLKTPGWSRKLHSPLVGEHNLRNVLGTAGMALALGLAEDAIVHGLEAGTIAPGRLESIENSRGARILVDFAHTPDGLFQVLKSLNALPHRRIITVFGCGGDRDRTKRPVMGGIAQQFSDLAILTSDNPRTEDPSRILEEVAAGMSADGNPHEIEPDRRAAIVRAVDLVEEGDILLVAGKGHETMQILGTELHHFDDRAVVREVLTETDGAALKGERP